MPYKDGNPTLTEQLEEDERRRFYTKDLIKEAKELQHELDEALKQLTGFERAMEILVEAHSVQVAELREALESIKRGNPRCPTPTSLLAWAQDIACIALEVGDKDKD